MKKFFGFALMCTTLMMSSAQAFAAADDDDVEVKTTITEKDGVVETVTKEITDLNCGLPLNKKAWTEGANKNYFCLANGLGLGLGWVQPLGAPDNMNTIMRQSVELDWNIIDFGYTFQRQNCVSVGLGLLWRNYRMRNGQVYNLTDDRVVEVVPLSDENDGVGKSRLHSLSLTIPVLYRHAWKSGWNITAGAELAFNCLKSKRYSTKTWYTSNNAEYTKVQQGVKFNPFNVNVIAYFAYKNSGVYVRYTPTHILKTDKGPEFQAISVGLRLAPYSAKISRKINQTSSK